MLRNEDFFLKVWPQIAQAVTGYRAGANAGILPLLRRLGVPRDARVLDVPCGYGRHAVMLARHGYRVTGVDFSPALLRQARKSARARRVEAEFLRGDMRRLRFRNRFHLVLNLFTSFGYFGDHGDQRVLERFHRALRPRGWLVMHLINRDYIVSHYQPHDRARLAGFRLEQRMRTDWESSVIHGEWIATFDRLRKRGARSSRVLRGATHLRIYSPHELVRMLRVAGFRRVQAYGGVRGEPVSPGRRWQTLVAQK